MSLRLHLKQFGKERMTWSQVPVAHASNPSYSGGRDHEGRGSKPLWANNSRDAISKKPNTKKSWLEWLKV
jgi:hypothetical protein